MLVPLLSLLGLGALCGTGLAIAAKAFYVYEDPRIKKVSDALPNVNCGGCGYAGCAACAEAIVAGEAKPTACVVSTQEEVMAISAIMGIEVEFTEPEVSENTCGGSYRNPFKFDYAGAHDCNALYLLFKGDKECHVACLGMGSCVKSCKFDAVTLHPKKRLPIFNPLKCVGCGACVDACPQDIVRLMSPSRRLLHFNTTIEGLAPCQQKCPAEIDISAYIKQIKMKNYEGAVRVLRDRNPFILSCGRVCPAPCETNCRRQLLDEAVSINQLKRFVADWEMNSGRYVKVSQAPDSGRSVAVVGGGPGGLSAAYFLRRLGHKVTVFDKMPKLGGMLRYGIPEYRLPKAILDKDIEGVLRLGVEARTDATLGEDFSLGFLKASGYDAVVLAVGAWSNNSMRTKGEDAEGVLGGIDFLEEVASGKDIDLEGKKVGIIGGGNTAIDAARTSKRLGAEKVSIIYRRTRNEMPANILEIVAAEEENIEMLFLTAPKSIRKNGKKLVMEYIKMELGEADASGRRRPVPIEGSESELELDLIIPAIGQAPDIHFMKSDHRLSEVETTKWDTLIAPKDTMQTNIPYVFTCGDSYSGPDLVVSAIGTGRLAARSVHQYLKGEKVEPNPYKLDKPYDEPHESIENVKEIDRVGRPELESSERIDSFIEVEHTISEKEALKEADRCMQCCLSCYNDEKQSTYL